MNEPDEPELHDAKLTALYRQDAQQMPSPASDAAILAAARRAVGAGPQRRPLLLRQRWLAPLLAAATVAVIAIGIVRMIPPEEITSSAPERYNAPAPATTPAPKPAPAPETAASAVAKAAPHDARPARLKQRPAAREAGDSSAFVPSPPAAPEPPRTVTTLPPSANESAPAARYEAPAATPPPPARATAQSAPSAAAAGAMVARKSLGAAPLPSQDAAVTRDPIKWISAIRELRNTGRRDEAARELAEFKRRYPDYELPLDLRDGK